jgi:hypothetical protein
MGDRPEKEITVSELKDNNQARRPWIAPDIRELDVRETSQLPNRGADNGGNPYIDCQRS